MKFSIILAVDEKNGLGKNNNLAWRIPADMKYFKKITTNSKKNVVIMGRKTWDSIPEKFKPLKNRINCIITRNIKNKKNSDNIKYFDDFDKCLSEFSENESIFLIGGATLYKKYLSHKKLDKIYLTKIKGDFDCDVFFDGVPKNFKVVSYTDSEEENNIEYSFWIYENKKIVIN